MKVPRIKCKRCKLHLYRRNIVPGRGTIPAVVLFIGEGPGRSEDLLGEAFVGRAGRVLDSLITDAKITSYYITNVVLCRPTDEFMGPNRMPSENEVLTCTNKVMRIIKLVHPELVVLLGKVAQKYYSKEFPESLYLHHPSFLARQGGVRSSYYQVTLRALKEAI